MVVVPVATSRNGMSLVVQLKMEAASAGCGWRRRRTSRKKRSGADGTGQLEEDEGHGVEASIGLRFIMQGSVSIDFAAAVRCDDLRGIALVLMWCRPVRNHVWCMRLCSAWRRKCEGKQMGPGCYQDSSEMKRMFALCSTLGGAHRQRPHGRAFLRHKCNQDVSGRFSMFSSSHPVCLHML